MWHWSLHFNMNKKNYLEKTIIFLQDRTGKFSLQYWNIVLCRPKSLCVNHWIEAPDDYWSLCLALSVGFRSKALTVQVITPFKFFQKNYLKSEEKNMVSNFNLNLSDCSILVSVWVFVWFSWYLGYYPHTTRELVSPVCRIFTESAHWADLV